MILELDVSERPHFATQIFYLIKFSTDRLTDAFRLEYGLDFFTVRNLFNLRGAFWHTAVRTMHLPVSSFVFHSSLLIAKSVE